MFLNKFINDLDSIEYTEMIQRGGGSMAIVFILLVLVIGGVVGFLFMNGTFNSPPITAPPTFSPKTTVYIEARSVPPNTLYSESYSVDPNSVLFIDKNSYIKKKYIGPGVFKMYTGQWPYKIVTGSELNISINPDPNQLGFDGKPLTWSLNQNNKNGTISTIQMESSPQYNFTVTLTKAIINYLEAQSVPPNTLYSESYSVDPNTVLFIDRNSKIIKKYVGPGVFKMPTGQWPYEILRGKELNIRINIDPNQFDSSGKPLNYSFTFNKEQDPISIIQLEPPQFNFTVILTK